jgi:hypothetical protein
MKLLQKLTMLQETNGRSVGQLALVEKGSTPAGRYIFTDGSGYPPTVLFLVTVS